MKTELSRNSWHLWKQTVHDHSSGTASSRGGGSAEAGRSWLILYLSFCGSSVFASQLSFLGLSPHQPRGAQLGQMLGSENL